jgi:spore maturation protein CgeB
MQKFYEKSGDIYLPYAYSTYDHYPVETDSKAYDVALIGMLYPNRIQLRDALNAAGYQTMFANGAVFDEARALYGQSRIGVSWSSLQDLIARVFEIMAMGLVPIINRVPDLPLHFKEGEHYLGFDTVSEALEKVKLVKENPEIGDTIIANAKLAVAPHNYDNRVKFILETIDAA